jgi:hypothetical protein
MASGLLETASLVTTSTAASQQKKRNPIGIRFQ